MPTSSIPKTSKRPWMSGTSYRRSAISGGKGCLERRHFKALKVDFLFENRKKKKKKKKTWISQESPSFLLVLNEFLQKTKEGETKVEIFPRKLEK